MHATRKGQGATEYLVLLAVVLIVAMVAIALLGFFPGITGNVQADQSKAYWTGVAKPFSIFESKQSGTNIQMIMKNSDPSLLYLEGITLSQGGAQLSFQESPRLYNTTGDKINVTSKSYFSPGESKLVSIYLTSPACTRGKPASYSVIITYRSEDIRGHTQVGTKDLIVQCSS